ncbi:MarR family winged helix-turn-helix transcriptional regulator [Actinoplanes awajinensis]|uniref:MarR family transcriptional regulator n=1 Tax=Actinoplanes awajinensis subsp. mycoplanecinus TaxID=135947 RepID=A0A101JB76_9ACTN|nr:MarR family transcriptional regulator [Actinoplanes awajinensis]KUL23581.1 MarR family transcriptional regulator [Actinoplanes awajinensis subsp. mycoplanecinus]
MPRDVREIGLSVKRLQHRHHRTANERLAPLGISLVQWDALRHLHENPEASLHDLAQLTFQTDQSFGTLATRMIDRELIERRPGPGRAIRHRLTAKGEALRVEAGEILEGVLIESFAPLDAEELQTLGDLLARLVSDRH